MEALCDKVVTDITHNASRSIDHSNYRKWSDRVRALTLCQYCRTVLMRSFGQIKTVLCGTCYYRNCMSLNPIDVYFNILILILTKTIKSYLTDLIQNFPSNFQLVRFHCSQPGQVLYIRVSNIYIYRHYKALAEFSPECYIFDYARIRVSDKSDFRITANLLGSTRPRGPEGNFSPTFSTSAQNLGVES